MPATSATATRLPERERDRGDRGRGDEHLDRAHAEDRPAQRPEPARVELEADQEKQHHHAELGEVQHRLRIADEREPPRTDRHAGGEIAEHRAEPERLKSGTAITPAAR